MATNYWVNRINFKEKIKRDLLPMLDFYVGRIYTASLFNDMQDLIVQWMSSLSQPIFPVDLIVRKSYDGYRNIIKSISVEIIDADL